MINENLARGLARGVVILCGYIFTMLSFVAWDPMDRWFMLVLSSLSASLAAFGWSR